MLKGLIFSIFLLVDFSSKSLATERILDVRMPNVSSPAEDALVCTSLKLDEASSYILEYIPHAFSNTSHHMMLYGCGQPGSTSGAWLCGEMDDQSDDSVCSDGERQIVYAWANDAPAKKLPPGVGFRVGADSYVKYLVLQMHYKEKFTDGRTDSSGLSVRVTTRRMPMQLGYYVLGTSGYIPPHQPGFHMETACVYDYNDTIIPIGFRTHSHNLGVVTSGYLVKNSSKEDELWTELGRMSPQKPQMFYPVNAEGKNIRRGDILAARCTMDSMNRTEVTYIGPTNHDEMCNFYIMFATRNPEPLQVRYCFVNAQQFRWSTYFKHIPSTASSLYGIEAYLN